MEKPKKIKPSKLNIEDHIKATNVDKHSHWAFDVEMQRNIEFHAYLLAEKDGFAGNPHDYWVAAERAVG